MTPQPSTLAVGTRVASFDIHCPRREERRSGHPERQAHRVQGGELRRDRPALEAAHRGRCDAEPVGQLLLGDARGLTYFAYARSNTDGFIV